jgi:hypothetical protein
MTAAKPKLQLYLGLAALLIFYGRQSLAPISAF